MIRFWRASLLALGLVAFAFQVGTAANVRCEMAAQSAAHVHGGHAGHHSDSSAPIHQSGCVCVAGCGVAFRLDGGLARFEVAVVPVALAELPVEIAPVLPLAARPFALPLSHAPPSLA